MCIEGTRVFSLAPRRGQEHQTSYRNVYVHCILKLPDSLYSAGGLGGNDPDWGRGERAGLSV